MKKTQDRAAVAVRAAEPTDAAAVADFLGGLSVDTAYRRFFAGVGRLPAPAVARLVTRDEDRGAWLALTGPAVVAHASWATVRAEPDRAEIAVVVADAWQGGGLGSRLIAAAAREAVAAGARGLRLEVLADNRRVLRMLARTWPGARPERDGGQLVYDVALPADYLSRAQQPARWSSTMPVACMSA